MLKVFFSLIIFFFLNITNSIAAEKIVYLDLDYLLANSTKGKEILLNLETINENNIKLLNKKEKNLSLEEKKLIQQKNILTKEIYNEKVSALRVQIKNFKEEKNRLLNEFKNKREESIGNFIKTIDKVLATYVKENAIDIVLNKKDILMGKNNYNITNDIMKIINNLN